MRLRPPHAHLVRRRKIRRRADWSSEVSTSTGGKKTRSFKSDLQVSSCFQTNTGKPEKFKACVDGTGVW